MKIVALSGSIVGSKTKTAIQYLADQMKADYADIEIQVIDLAEYKLQFSDGRNYLDYDGDTQYVAKSIMSADAIIIGTPIFQASIPGTLKNVFDLLPVNGLRDKVVSLVVTAGSARHYLIAEQQIKPILSYMKAQIVQTYVFIEETDFYQKQIKNEDVLFRLDRLAEDTVTLTKTYQQMLAEKEAHYDF